MGFNLITTIGFNFLAEFNINKNNSFVTGFSWEFNARGKMKGYTFKEVKIIHKKRKYGETKIYRYRNLPKIAFRHLIGMLKIKFFNG